MNAIVHHRENGQVEVSVTRNGDVVRLCVRDDGPGIPEEHLPRLFDRFYRVDPSRSRQQGGSGLGLSICKQIVESHGGNLSVDSQVGHGSCFVATFPQTPMPNPETKRDQSEGDSTAS
jgi:signal transduction histidine kinase